MSELLGGRCFCGQVRYRCGPLLSAPTLCHCESCRRAAGAPAVGWLTVARADFAWTRGELREYESSPGVYRSFCPRCGTPLTYRSDAREGEIDVTLGSLDDPAVAAPVDHIWMADAPAWDRPGDGRPTFPRSRGLP
jgi:hypothetical protein